MEAQNRFKSSPLEKLILTPEKFNFFQVIRLLEKLLGENSSHPLHYKTLIGTKALPFQEKLRLKHSITLSFTAAEINSFQVPNTRQKLFQNEKIVIETCFMGLAGSSGPLPSFYTDIILERNRLGDTNFNDFLSIFNHRLLSFMYRAWAKNKIFIEYECAHHYPQKKDWSAIALQSLHGNSLLSTSPSFLKRIGVFYAGLLAKQPRSAEGLRQLLTLYLSCPVQIVPFMTTQLCLTKDSLTTLGKKALYNKLGETALLGRKIWSLENKFVVLIGPLDLKSFQQFLFQNSPLQSLQELINYYINNNLNYTLQLILKAQHVPPCQMTSQSSFRLGQNTWLIAKDVLVDKRDTFLKTKRF